MAGRRRRGREARPSLGLGERMLEAAVGARIVKAAGSRQIARPEDDGFLDLYEADRAIRPPLPMDKLLARAERVEAAGRSGQRAGRPQAAKRTRS
jgi:hypothetical protein